MSTSQSDIISTLTSTLTNLQKILDLNLNEKILQSLPDSELTQTEKLSELFCNNNGNYVSVSKCDCDIAYFGSRCNVPGLVYWGKGWTAFQVLFTIFYVLMGIFTWYHLYKYLSLEYGGFWKKVGRLLQTPKYLVILNLLVICNSMEKVEL